MLLFISHNYFLIRQRFLKNMAVNSLIIQAQATIANNWPISYSFVYEGLFTNSLFEFYINTTTGMITLNKPLSLSVATLREVIKFNIKMN